MVVSVFIIEHKVRQEYWFLEFLDATVWKSWILSYNSGCPVWLEGKRKMGMWP